MKTKRSNQLRIGGIVEKGFTLVELLIVVIILAILAAIVVPQFAATTNDARDSAADSTLSGLRAAIDLYNQQHNNTYPGAVTAVSGTCPAPGATGIGAGGTGIPGRDAFMSQLTLYTDSAGGTCSVGDAVNFRFGPYLKKVDRPSDPYLAVSALEVLDIGNLNMLASAPPGPGGFKYDVLTGKIIINITAEETR